MWEKELCDILEEEKKILLKILEIEKQKKEYLINRNLDNILDINMEEEKIFNELDKYEFARNELVKKVSQKLQILAEEITLSKIIEFASNKQRLEALKEEIVSIISEIKQISYENRILIESAMNVSLAVIEKITDLKTTETQYNNQGKKEIKINLSTYSTIT